MPRKRLAPRASSARARAAFSRHAWRAAYDEYEAANRRTSLGATDLERWATAAMLIGRDEDHEILAERAHFAFLDRGDITRAARCAFWLGFHLSTTRGNARASGWLARARRLTAESASDPVLAGYLCVPDGISLALDGKADEALDRFEQATEIGTRHGDAQLVAMGRHGTGRVLMRTGRIADGVALLDEVMVSVVAGEVMPVAQGGLYCSMIGACHEVLDLRRAHEWTDALARVCQDQPDLVLHRGHCLVRRAEMLQVRGAWAQAVDEVERAIDMLSTTPDDAVFGAALYRRAELHRLRGSLRDAERHYRLAAERGRAPNSGLALLRLAQGRVGDAVVLLRAAPERTLDRAALAQDLAARVEVMLAANDIEEATRASHELGELARALRTPYARGLAAQAIGAVLLRGGRIEESLRQFAAAARCWRETGAVHDGARLRLLIGDAHRALGDEESAAAELAAASRTFAELGASPDLARIEEIRQLGAGDDVALTPRERQVLSLVAGGKTNRAIASALRISEKTAARHVANIFAKLSLPNRATATAYAYQHGLV